MTEPPVRIGQHRKAAGTMFGQTMPFDRAVTAQVPGTFFYFRLWTVASCGDISFVTVRSHSGVNSTLVKCIQ